MEYAVLNVPGFKVVKGVKDNARWVRVHTGESATTPYRNEHRWWLGIRDSTVAEYLSLKAKVRYWKCRKNHKMFDADKFVAYEKSLEELLNNNDEFMIKYKLLSMNVEAFDYLKLDFKDMNV